MQSANGLHPQAPLRELVVGAHSPISVVVAHAARAGRPRAARAGRPRAARAGRPRAARAGRLAPRARVARRPRASRRARPPTSAAAPPAAARPWVARGGAPPQMVVIRRLDFFFLRAPRPVGDAALRFLPAEVDLRAARARIAACRRVAALAQRDLGL